MGQEFKKIGTQFDFHLRAPLTRKFPHLWYVHSFELLLVDKFQCKNINEKYTLLKHNNRCVHLQEGQDGSVIAVRAAISSQARLC